MSQEGSSGQSTDFIGEVWLPVVGHESKYAVSNLGRVKSFIYKKEGHILRPGIASNGYPTVALSQKTRTVHSLVLEAFVGPRPEGHEACHGNGDRKDARLVNLRYAPFAENQADKRKHGTHIHGDRVKTSKLKEPDIINARALASMGVTHLQIANWLGVSRPTVTNIVLRETWKHVP